MIFQRFMRFESPINVIFHVLYSYRHEELYFTTIGLSLIVLRESLQSHFTFYHQYICIIRDKPFLNIILMTHNRC